MKFELPEILIDEGLRVRAERSIKRMMELYAKVIKIEFSSN